VRLKLYQKAFRHCTSDKVRYVVNMHEIFTVRVSTWSAVFAPWSLEHSTPKRGH